MRAGYIQSSPIFGEKNSNFSQIRSLAEGVNADLLVLPELFATGYAFSSKEELRTLAEDPEGETARFLKDLSERTGALLVGGFAEREGKRLYNSAMLVSSVGVIGIYRKLHLFNKEKLWFDPGDSAPGVFEVGGFKLGIMICFDWIYPETARSLALRGADLIVHPANLVLPYCQDAMRTRCIENRVYAITANRIGRERRGDDDFTFTGASQITSYRGEILSSAPSDRTSVAVCDIDPKKTRDKRINAYNDLLRDRRKDLYHA